MHATKAPAADPYKNPIDDMPIPVQNQCKKTFEQLLEEELAREAGQHAGHDDGDAGDGALEPPSESKKSFLKRKSASKKGAKKTVNTTAKKNYRYYVDNF